MFTLEDKGSGVNSRRCPFVTIERHLDQSLRTAGQSIDVLDISSQFTVFYSPSPLEGKYGKVTFE